MDVEGDPEPEDEDRPGLLAVRALVAAAYPVTNWLGRRAVERHLADLRPQRAASRCYLGETAFARSTGEMLLELSRDSRTRGELEWRQGWKWKRERILARTRALWRDVCDRPGSG